MGFRKVDPDRWEFANEGFLGGQRHLLKMIKRRRNVMQSANQQSGGPSVVELGHYGMEEELERLRRDRNLLMSEVMKLKHHQQSSRSRIIEMEERIRSTEKKQQQIMTFLAKAFRSPLFVQQYMDKYVDKIDVKNIEIGQKRRLTMSPSVENLHEVVNVSASSNKPLNYMKGEDEELVESLFSAALDDESSADLKGSTGETNLHDVANIWEEFLNDDDAVVGDEAEQVDVEVEELVAKAPDWDGIG